MIESPQATGSLPWEPDRPLDAAGARSAIQGAFPSVDAGEVSAVGAGWEFDVFVTADRWAFRFPRRAEYQRLFDRERPVLALARSALPPGIRVPLVELIGRPAGAFPYTFGGHRFIEGVAADVVSPARHPDLARTLGQTLGAIHAVPVATARAAGVSETGPPGDGGGEWFRRNLTGATRLATSDVMIDRAVAWVSRLDHPLSGLDSPIRFIHHDLWPEHLVADPSTGELVGVLDWTDTLLGDAAGDFVSCVLFAGWPFAEKVLSHYPHALDTGFVERLRFMARFLSVMWLGEAEQFRGNVGRHKTWVRNALAGQSAS